MHFDDSEKPGRKAALQKLIDMMGSKMGEKLGGLKKPVAASISVEKVPEGDDDDMPGAEPDGDEPSEEDKAKIAELYHRYCK